MLDETVRILEGLGEGVDWFLEGLYQDRWFQNRELGNYALAEENIRKALDLRRKIWGAGSRQAGWALERLALVLMDQGHAGEAVEHFATVAAIEEEHVGLLVLEGVSE